MKLGEREKFSIIAAVLFLTGFVTLLVGCSFYNANIGNIHDVSMYYWGYTAQYLGVALIVLAVVVAVYYLIRRK